MDGGSEQQGASEKSIQQRQTRGTRVSPIRDAAAHAP